MRTAGRGTPSLSRLTQPRSTSRSPAQHVVRVAGSLQTSHSDDVLQRPDHLVPPRWCLRCRLGDLVLPSPPGQHH